MKRFKINITHEEKRPPRHGDTVEYTDTFTDFELLLPAEPYTLAEIIRAIVEIATKPQIPQVVERSADFLGDKD